MSELLDRFSRIAIEGPIGVGKTSLAKKLSEHLKAKLVLEQAMQNPFLPSFYANGRTNAMSTQLSFLYQRFDQLQNLSTSEFKEAGIVMDYMFEKNQVFANLTLNEKEKIYTKESAQTFLQSHIQPLI